MPIYEYECKSCSTRFEVKQSMGDEPLKVCPECQGEVRRVFFPVGIVFKGSGFYVTDHGRGRTPTPTRSEESSSTPEASKKEEKKEDKAPVAASTSAGENKKDS